MDRVYLVNKTSEMASPGGYFDADEAYRMLRNAALEYDNLQHFRDVWIDETRGGGVFPPTDRSVLQYLAERLANGVLAVARKARPDRNSVVRRPTGGAAPAPLPPPETPQPRVDAPLKLRPRPPTLPPELTKALAPLVDAAQQASCLLDAAKDGLPFCEQCAKG